MEAGQARGQDVVVDQRVLVLHHHIHRVALLGLSIFGGLVPHGAASAIVLIDIAQGTRVVFIGQVVGILPVRDIHLLLRSLRGSESLGSLRLLLRNEVHVVVVLCGTDDRQAGQHHQQEGSRFHIRVVLWFLWCKITAFL